MWLLNAADFLRERTLLTLRRVVRREQGSSIAIKQTFAPPQINKGNINDYIWSKHVDFYIE